MYAHYVHASFFPLFNSAAIGITYYNLGGWRRRKKISPMSVVYCSSILVPTYITCMYLEKESFLLMCEWGGGKEGPEQLYVRTPSSPPPNGTTYMAYNGTIQYIQRRRGRNSFQSRLAAMPGRFIALLHNHAHEILCCC